MNGISAIIKETRERGQRDAGRVWTRKGLSPDCSSLTSASHCEQ